MRSQGPTSGLILAAMGQTFATKAAITTSLTRCCQQNASPITQYSQIKILKCSRNATKIYYDHYFWLKLVGIFIDTACLCCNS